MCRSLVLLSLLSLTWASPVFAQIFESGDSGPRELLPRAREIALAKSAAPPAVSDSATIYVLTAGGYELALEGSGGTACYVSRDWTISLEPHCFDGEGAATIMRIHMRKVDLLHAGMTLEETSATVAGELLQGELRLPDRPVMSWMQSSAQELVSADGRPVGAWKPHVMIYYPYLTAKGAALDGAPSGLPSSMVAGSGSALSALVVVVPDFVDPRPPAGVP